MKKNEKRKLWKQGLGTALVCGLAVAVFPAAKADAADLLKAGPINTTAEHVTQKQPFAEGTAGSQYFRIPAFIVTQKGNLLAAADARYSTTGDGGGLDTIASVSTDNGKTWNYSFPLYFPDSDGLYRQYGNYDHRPGTGTGKRRRNLLYCRCKPNRRNDNGRL